MSLKELDQALELAVTTNVIGQSHPFDINPYKSEEIKLRLMIDGLIDDFNCVTLHGRTFYDSGGYSKERNRRILRQVLGWLFGILSGLFVSWLASLIWA